MASQGEGAELLVPGGKVWSTPGTWEKNKSSWKITWKINWKIDVKLKATNCIFGSTDLESAEMMSIGDCFSPVLQTPDTPPSSPNKTWDNSFEIQVTLFIWVSRIPNIFVVKPFFFFSLLLSNFLVSYTPTPTPKVPRDNRFVYQARESSLASDSPASPESVIYEVFVGMYECMH